MSRTPAFVAAGSLLLALVAWGCSGSDDADKPAAAAVPVAAASLELFDRPYYWLGPLGAVQHSCRCDIASWSNTHLDGRPSGRHRAGHERLRWYVVQRSLSITQHGEILDGGDQAGRGPSP